MGEYALRLSDHTQVKIGTCEDMLYLRFEDRAKVRKVPNSLDPAHADGLRFRLPFPDEDSVPIGQYADPFRRQRLYRGNDNFTDESTAKEPGIMQLRHECGLLLNVPCYHGHKLPDVGPEMKAFWNGKAWSLELSAIKPVKQDDGTLKVFPIVTCRHCRGLWRYDWTDIIEFIPEPLRARLNVYQERTF